MMDYWLSSFKKFGVKFAKQKYVDSSTYTKYKQGKNFFQHESQSF